jgi:hypothetical protein
MIHTYEIEGLRVQTGDLLCTTDGGGADITGQFWRLIGKLIPGDIDHIIIYVGPGGRCVEAGAKGKVITFDVIACRGRGGDEIPRARLSKDSRCCVSILSADVDPARTWRSGGRCAYCIGRRS